LVIEKSLPLVNWLKNCLTNSMYNIENFESSGYVVIKNFLDQHEIHMLLDDYNSFKSDISAQNYFAVFCSKPALNKIKSKIENVSKTITDQTSLTVDIVSVLNFYGDTSSIHTPWHQDHEPWAVYQNNQNHLNFHLVLQKETPNQSGLGLIPLDVISQYTSELEHSVSKGAMSFQSHDDYTDVWDDELGIHFKIQVGLDSIGVYPELLPGDLLLFRGDVIHRTQDNNTKRISLAVRAFNSDTVILKSRLITSLSNISKYRKSPQPKNTSGNNDNLVFDSGFPQMILNIYGDREAITVGELVKKMSDNLAH